MTRLIEHIIEPTKLLMTWQDKQTRTRYTVAEILRAGSQVTLKYLADSPELQKAFDAGFEPYPAFQNMKILHTHGVLDALMRRLPPRTRADFPQYLEALRIKPGTELSDFALLGYSGAKLPSDNFAIINPFENINSEFEFLLEAAGYRHLSSPETIINDQATFKVEFDYARNEEVIKIFTRDKHIGYVTKALIPSVKTWIGLNRIKGAWVEKKNGNPEQPVTFLYVQISSIK